GYHPLQVDGNCDTICDRICGRKWYCIPLRIANRKGTPLPICDSEMHFASRYRLAKCISA
ncbi:hypothetical protein NDU88_000473, partial [Pleurodeles waltl]